MKRVVFLPYLSAMWASLAPLYEEHKAAGDDVYVMPLYYGIRDTKGHVSTYRVDNNFPVPTIKPSIEWLKENHPDTIYFHNPYDEINSVTNIHPSFYSSELAKYTDDLVYVPYYSLGIGGNIPRRGYLPGVRHAHRIIVWTYPDRKQHVLDRVLAQGWEGHATVKERPEPKRYTEPLEWGLIRKNRKLIMLGTSLGALLERRDEEFDRITKAIMDNQNDICCLLWRPHPLYDATLYANFPYLRKRYYDMIHNFIRFRQGILDESWDVERAVTLCAEYIGDPSSVAEFFLQQGKPVKYI